MTAPQQKPRFLLQHVWKTGGSEFCYLVRANGWTTPSTHNCYMNLNTGWPKDDYDLVANERPMMVVKGKIQTDFRNYTENDIAVQNVQWITLLRHPYSRSLSHFYHMKGLNRSHTFSLPEFLTNHAPPYSFFHKFVPNQQTRWHCGTWECSQAVIGPEHLTQAMVNLEQFPVVLILEDMKDPNSCTRLQMRHVLNLTKVEVLEDLHRTNSSKYVKERLFRRPATNWYKEVMPHLNRLGHTDGDNGTTAWGEGSQVMSALGLYNDMDLQLYGYARKLCNDRGIAIRRKLALERAMSPVTTDRLLPEAPKLRPAEIQQLQQSRFRTKRNDTLWIQEAVEPNRAASVPSLPSFATLQVSSVIIVSLWMLMLPSIRRLRFKLCAAR